MTILITGSSGFIGYHLAQRLLDAGQAVVGYDNLNPYYDVALKRARQSRLEAMPGFVPVVADLTDMDRLKAVFAQYQPRFVLNLAAQAGVRYSLEQPGSYIDSNIVGSFHILECARAYPPQHLLMASTSSVYGANTAMPYRENDKADTPMSLYAATKKAGEAMAHSYAHLFHIPTTMFRFFTVYGPWGRPDMAPIKFAKAMLAGETIDVYNQGQMYRDFTYVEDLVEAIHLLMATPPQRPATAAEIKPGDSLSPVAPFRVVNIGGNQKVSLMTFIETLEACLGVKAKKNFLPMQAGDVQATWADSQLLEDLTGYRPDTPLKFGLQRFADWMQDYYANEAQSSGGKR